jgi:hypothetical protein
MRAMTTQSPETTQPQVIRPEEDAQRRLDAAQRQEQEQAKEQAQPTVVVQNEAADREIERQQRGTSVQGQDDLSQQPTTAEQAQPTTTKKATS